MVISFRSKVNVKIQINIFFFRLSITKLKSNAYTHYVWLVKYSLLHIDSQFNAIGWITRVCLQNTNGKKKLKITYFNSYRFYQNYFNEFHVILTSTNSVTYVVCMYFFSISFNDVIYRCLYRLCYNHYNDRYGKIRNHSNMNGSVFIIVCQLHELTINELTYSFCVIIIEIVLSYGNGTLRDSRAKWRK